MESLCLMNGSPETLSSMIRTSEWNPDNEILPKSLMNAAANKSKNTASIFKSHQRQVLRF